MSVFTTDNPSSQYAINPQYATGQSKAALALTGYKANGSQNGWWQVSSWIPGIGLELNQAGKGIAKNAGATDSFENISEDTDNRIQKLGVEGGLAMSGVGAFTGNPQLIAKGLSMSANFGGQLAFDQTGMGLTDDFNYVYR